MHKTILTAVMAALIVALPISCVTCPPNVDNATCKVQQAEAIAQLVDVAAGTLVAGYPSPVLIAAYATFHAALPLAIKALDAALAEYEAGHTGAWSVLLAGLQNLYESFDALYRQVTGRASLVTAAQATVKAQGAQQVLLMMKTNAGRTELMKSMMPVPR